MRSLFALRPLLAFVGLSLAWGSEWLLAASTPAQPQLRSLALRYGLGALVLAPGAVRGRFWRKPLRNVVQTGIIGVGILCLPQILIFVSGRRLSSAVVVVALAATPVILAIAGRLSIPAAMCGFAGAVFLLSRGLSLALTQWPWLLAAVVAAAVLAGSLVAAEKYLSGSAIAEALFVQLAASALLLWIASGLIDPQAIAWSTTTAIGFAISTLIATAGAYLLFYWLLRQLGVAKVSTLQWTQPLIAMIESTAILRLRWDWQVVTGAILIVAATAAVFSNRDQARGVLFEITRR